jgi:hypothetical protein
MLTFMIFGAIGLLLFLAPLVTSNRPALTH